MGASPTIGVLALQGAVELHASHIEAAGGLYRAVKTADEIAAADAYILPGGESTTMLKLIDRFGLWDALAENFAAKPVWGICAGAILIAETVWVDGTKTQRQKSFGLLPFSVVRNGYGRQLDSHVAEIDGYPVSFIRAPVFEDVSETARVRAIHRGQPVWVEYGAHMATAFHPELTLDFPSPMHVHFIKSIAREAA
ncbi:MAG: pyridoxal 5'-phosphate synthase glutaminase subunit PdxT [Rhodospirillales bacterium]|nr:pyridoxal 5'-phosphate synthase glutaminase subunit PdxT [Alphaproteobacteria bacterium]MCB9987625.1 pyridoxal 5'-phosphate synthase glutaminase subunit PdxT [Rhodospirillales bacterium]USO08076.1 MAG: pyridoxal 5'-phosphate synthase glutaminase subunit PdxT [Rhodospirillales bacterium]